MALAQIGGATTEEIKAAMPQFRGVDRRFDFKIKNSHIVFLSDYAHHPEEIRQSVSSIRKLYPNRKITAVFQPHLYTRTRDFYQDFAHSLVTLRRSDSVGYLSSPGGSDTRSKQSAYL